MNIIFKPMSVNELFEFIEDINKLDEEKTKCL